MTEITDDPTLFSFRLYLGTENDSFDDLPLANMYRYYVKNPAGYYCQWDADNQQFISYGKKEENMVAADWDNVSFRTSMNGSISKIPIGYTVEIREVLFDTKYKVEERDYEVPDGYSLQKYLLNNVEQIDTDTDLPAGVSDGLSARAAGTGAAGVGHRTGKHAAVRTVRGRDTGDRFD